MNYDYQLQGINKIVKSFREQRGFLLCDAAGLGKTVQTIKALKILYEENENLFFPVLILAPKSVIIQWHDELKKFGFQGKVSSNNIDDKNVDVNILTYEKFEILYNQDDVYWSSMILDEIAKIKNESTLIHKTVIHASKTVRCRLGLSASPVQNSPNELYNIFRFIEPRLLGDIEVFERNFSNIINIAGRRNASEISKVNGIQAGKTLNKIISKYYLRRKIEDKLAIKTGHTVIYVELTKKERIEYDKINTNKGDDEGEQYKGKGNSFRKQFKLFSIVNGIDEDGLYNINGSKINTLINMTLQFIKENHSVVIFVKQLLFMELVKIAIKRYRNLSYESISGKNTSLERKNKIDNFNNGKLNILIMTSRSSSLGINLQKCSRLIVAEHDVNPTINQQAASRAIRINSTENVGVYTLITKDTIDEHFYERSKEKNKSNKMVLDEYEDEEKKGKIIIDDEFLITNIEVSEENKIFCESLIENDFSCFNIEKNFIKEKKLMKPKLIILRNLKKILIKKLKHKSMSTSQVISKFKRFCNKNNIQPFKFKEILNHVATCSLGIWTIKKRYYS